MTDYQKVLEANPLGVLATRKGDALDTRVLHSLFAKDNKVYFCTSSEKRMYAQLAANPEVSFCTYSQNFSPVLTLNGKAVFVEDLGFKARVMEESDMVKNNYKTPDNPDFKLFYIDIKEIKTYIPGEGTTREDV